jgi:hypothetical protein
MIRSALWVGVEIVESIQWDGRFRPQGEGQGPFHQIKIQTLRSSFHRVSPVRRANDSRLNACSDGPCPTYQDASVGELDWSEHRFHGRASEWDAQDDEEGPGGLQPATHRRFLVAGVSEQDRDGMWLPLRIPNMNSR